MGEGGAVVGVALYVRTVNYRSVRLTNVCLHPALGGVDIQALGIRS